MSAGLTPEGIEALDTVLTSHVARGSMPGLVALVASGDDVHVAALGHKAFGDEEPIGRDAIFRIASLTKPIAGVAAMLLIEDGAMALGDPVGQWLPELSEPRVLRTLESSLDDTVPAERPITVEDVLSFHLGFGSIMSLGPYPIWQAESDLGLKTLGPPWPPPDLTPDEWIARLGQLPLLDQPGTRWRYNTGATVAGVLIERVAGAPLAEVMKARVFEPLGMADTGFWVPADKMGRFTTFYAPGDARGRPAGRLVVGATQAARRRRLPGLDRGRPVGVRHHAGLRWRRPALGRIGAADDGRPHDGPGPRREPGVRRRP
jgi:CubicO group peptidase (beta-lactamase class C family)